MPIIKLCPVNAEHGEVDLEQGCPTCVLEKRTAELATLVKENMDKDPNAWRTGEEEVREEEPNIIMVRYYSQTTGEASEKEYAYYSVERLAVGDLLMVPTRNTNVKAIVSAIDVPVTEIEAFKDSVKSIPVGSKLVDQSQTYEGEPELVIEEAKLPLGGLAAAAREVEESPTETTAVIKINPTLTPSFAEHLEAAKRILEIAKSRTILSEEDAKSANDDLTTMKKLIDAVDGERKTFTVPLNEYLKSINTPYKQITDPLAEADRITRIVLTAYKVEQNRKAAAAEALNIKAIELAKEQAAANNGEFTSDITPVPIPHAPKLTRTDQGSSGLRDNWKWKETNLELIPREYLIPDKTMLDYIATKDHDQKVIAGIEFYNDPGLQVRSK